MNEIRNGMPATRLIGVEWRKSSASGAAGACVEVAWLPTELVAVRDSRDPHGPALVWARAELNALTTYAKNR